MFGFDFSKMEEVGKNISEFLSSADSRMSRIEANQKLIMEKMGIETPEQREAMTQAAIRYEEQKNV